MHKGHSSQDCRGIRILYNYPPKGRWIVVDIYRDAKGRGIYPPLFTDPEGDSCFSIYQIRWIKKCCFNFFFWNFRETTRHFSLRSQNSEYPRIFLVTGANQNTQILLSTDLVNTNVYFPTTSRITAISRPCELLPLQTLLVLVSVLSQQSILSRRQTNIHWQSPICTYFIHKLNGFDALTQNLGPSSGFFLALWLSLV